MTTLIAALAVSAIQPQAAKPEVKLVLDSEQAVVGSLVSAKVRVTFADGLHGYQNPPTEDYMIPVVVSMGEESKTFMVKYPKGTPAIVGGDTKEVMTYEGVVDFPVVFRVSEKVGSQPVSISVRYQLCNASACFAPGSVKAEGKLKVVAAPKGWNAVRARSNDILVLSQFKAVSE